MCCFSGRVSDVSGTNIFARIDGDWEYVVYEMTFTSSEETAMILPIPIATDSADDAVEFVALDDYPDFFRHLEAHFQRVWANARMLGGSRPQVALKVETVGAFEASFAPSLDQLDRVDARFRIPRQVWNQLPAYASYGFVVFKLRPGHHVNVHPMAFSFRTRDPATLFFPTVHVHDGTVHEKASFDHIFYTQNEPRPGRSWPAVWMPSVEPASTYMRVRRTHGFVDRDAHCYRASLVGTWKNQDTFVPI